jgi:putative nucleotidyltransferase with HDIG domain
VALGFAFVVASAAIAMMGEAKIDYVVGQRIDQPIYAKVDFQVPDPARTNIDKEAARAETPSYYVQNKPALTFERIRADLLRVYQAAADSPTFEAFEKNMDELRVDGGDRSAYDRLRGLVAEPGDVGRERFAEWVKGLPLEKQCIAEDLLREPREPRSNADYLLLQLPAVEGQPLVERIPHSQVISNKSITAVQGVASMIARRHFAGPFEFRSIVDSVVAMVFLEQPTILFDQARTIAAMQAATDAVPEAIKVIERDKPFINPGEITDEAYDLLKAHQAAYLEFLEKDTDHARQLRLERLLHRSGLAILVALVCAGLVAYCATFQGGMFQEKDRAASFFIVIAVTLLAARLLDMRWPQYPELLFIPTLMAAAIVAIVYPNRFALGVSCILAVLVTLVARSHLPLLLALLTGVVVAVYQLDEIRTRTKLPTAGAVTSMAVMVAAIAGGFVIEQRLDFVIKRALLSGVVTFAAAGGIALLLPFIERLFNTATALSLLEWRDPTKPLLQLLAREAPGTYSHSLVLGTLAEAACDKIAANGLLAQVGALYHDVGKIHRPGYFTENQEGRISRHENLAPTMSLLIILGHVKDGLELARQYKLPRLLHQFIAEHHGTTVVRYFHRMASEKQPHIASGRHDREVAEADFRYGGPKPHSKESAVLMLCDGVEGAVRSLGEPTVGRIESTVQQIVADRLSDGQFDECDITLREIRLVEESLVKSLCSIYHGRVAYPKPAKVEQTKERQRMTV